MRTSFIILAIISIIVLAALSGCTSTTYTDNEGRSVKSSAFFTDRGPTKIVYVDGDKRAEIDIGQRTQTDAITKLTDFAKAVK